MREVETTHRTTSKILANEKLIFSKIFSILFIENKRRIQQIYCNSQKVKTFLSKRNNCGFNSLLQTMRLEALLKETLR